jgi:hypothetical protein
VLLVTSVRRPLMADIQHDGTAHSVAMVCPKCPDFQRIMDAWWAGPRDREGYPVGPPERIPVDFHGPTPVVANPTSNDARREAAHG